MILVNVIREGEKIRGGKAGNHPPQKIEVHLFTDCIIVYLKTLENQN